MRITRFHTTEDGGSTFVELPEGLDQTWHPASRRQIVVVLSGLLEVTTTDGPVEVLFAPMPAEVDLNDWLATP